MAQSSSGAIPTLSTPGGQNGPDAVGGPHQPEVKAEAWPRDDISEPHLSEDEEKRASLLPEALCEDVLSKGRSDVAFIQSSFSRSLQKAESLLRTRLNPGLRWLLKQKSDDSGEDPESEGSFVACQNLTSRSSRRLQRLEQCMLGLSQHSQVLREPGAAVPRACIGAPCSDSEFRHHPAAATFGHGYGQLRALLEDRAQLLFLHEIARRHRAATAFVATLSGLMEREQPPLAWGYGIGALCEELRLHAGAWDCLCTKAKADPWLRASAFWSSRTAAAARHSLMLLGLQALALTECYVRLTLSALALAPPPGPSADILEDALIGVETFNHIAGEEGAHVRHRARGGMRGGPTPFPMGRLLQVLAECRGWVAAEAVHCWAADCAGFPPGDPQRQRWEQVRWPPNPPQTPPGGACPLAALIRQDAEFTEHLFQALLATDLVAQHVPSQPKPVCLHTANASPGDPRDLQEGLEAKRCKSVQWRDARKSDTCVALAIRYRRMLWSKFNRALLALLYSPPQNCILGSLNQCKDHMVLMVVIQLHSVCRIELLPAESKGVLNDLCTQMVAKAAFSRWDEVMCASLGTGLKDKCLPVLEEGSSTVRTATTELLLQLFPPLHTTLCCLESSAGTAPLDQRMAHSLHLGLFSRAVASVHSSTLWVMGKAYQFLSAWALGKFLLVTLGDLKVLKAEVERLGPQVETLGVNRDATHSQIEQQAAQLTRGVADLQGFSELVLRIFSKDCKRMAVEIFEQTMPSGKHWRVTCKTELPSSPSDYATSAAQTVIGQVLEGVQSFPDEAQISVLTEAMTAFMEAWMEHILKKKIKFSLQGALQLKQDFDMIRELIRSEEYRLSEEIHQRLLSLRVFHQVDSAIVCLLQQPVAKPYIPSRSWEPFRRCCPHRGPLVDPGSGSLNSLESMDIQAARAQALMEAEGSLAPRLTTSPPESYLDVSQQEWLALRIHNGTRWKLPGLQCLNKSEH
ncbi:uncharacterized protein ccdc142 isoform X1 [Megalops cyprinoides]|uniref:uncharacterized protein ccdc142 isoform X1 n=1 Tax=Megalops cyprinoides TaxID=118141 RepID=UPI0018643FF2|nr:uncharacterized protein ccdc142 isoform X1 [Megalops cyprinoides]XP_036407392.1 uncharacterized protein ccdc142 isoform X1 [Megalops cyprinoides]